MMYVFAWYALASLTTVILYWIDKRKATRNAWRIKESTLHLLELLGGWPGAFFAQRWLHHKSTKQKYQLVFWSIVLLHLIGWGGYAYLKFR